MAGRGRKAWPSGKGFVLLQSVRSIAPHLAAADRQPPQADRFRGKPVIYLLGNHEYYDGRLDTTLAEARREAEGSNVHLLDGDELVINGVRFLGATLWTDFKLTIATPEGPISDVGRAMKMATNLLNDYALIRTVDDSAEPDNEFGCPTSWPISYQWHARCGRATGVGARIPPVGRAIVMDVHPLRDYLEVASYWSFRSR